MTDDLDDLTDEERDRREAEFLEALSRKAGEFIIGMVRRFAPCSSSSVISGSHSRLLITIMTRSPHSGAVCGDARTGLTVGGRYDRGLPH